MTGEPPAAAEASVRRRRRRPTGTPPPLPREVSGGAWTLLGLTAIFAVGWLVVFADSEARLFVWFNERETEVLRALTDLRTEWLTDVVETIHRIGYTWAVPVIGWTTIGLLLIAKRLRQALVYFGSLVVVSAIVLSVANAIGRPRPWGIDQLGPWEGFAQPSLPVAQLSVVLVGAGLGLLAGRRRHQFRIVVVGGIVGFGLSRLYLGLEYPTDGIVGAFVGATVTVAGFVLICPEKVFPVGFGSGRTAHLDIGGARGEAIKRAVRDQLGFEVTSVEPFGQAESAGSTPMLLTMADGGELFGKLYARNHLRSDRWYKLGRTLLYGRLEDEAPFQTVRRLVEREDYLLRLMRDAGIAVPAPVGIATITPEREYMILTEFLRGAEEITDADIDETIVDHGLRLVRDLWESGLAHRDIKPANVMIRDGRAYVIDVAFAEVQPTPWREAVDLVNMMLSLALRRDAAEVYERALLHFSEDEIAEGLAAARGVTLPSQLRRKLKEDERDLLAEFAALAPERPRIPIQRWTLRRLALALWVGLLAVLGIMLGAGNLEGIGLL